MQRLHLLKSGCDGNGRRSDNDIDKDYDDDDNDDDYSEYGFAVIYLLSITLAWSSGWR